MKDAAYELGCIAAAAADVSGKTIENPYPFKSFEHGRWERGFRDEVERLQSDLKT